MWSPRLLHTPTEHNKPNIILENYGLFLSLYWHHALYQNQNLYHSYKSFSVCLIFCGFLFLFLLAISLCHQDKDIFYKILRYISSTFMVDLRRFLRCQKIQYGGKRERETQPLIKLWFLGDFDFFKIIIYRPFLVLKRFSENFSA